MGALGSFAGGMFATKGRVFIASALFALAAAVLLVLTGLAQAQNGTFSNNAAISVPGANTSGHASPYPSIIGVSGMTGDIADVNVTLTGVGHTNPDDVDVLLVGPEGQNVRLVSDSGGTNDIIGVNFTLDDEATASLADSAQLTTGAYAPTNHGSGTDTFSDSGVSEATPYGAALSVFDATDPNGDWKLYVVDDAGSTTVPNTGQISGGWSIEISTNNDPPVISGAVGGAADEGSPATVAVTATDGQNDPLAYSFDCDNNGNFTGTGDTASQPGNVGECTFDDNGSYPVGVKVSDGKANGTDTDTATVTVTNAPPTATLENDGPINEGGTATVAFSNPSDPSDADTNAGFRYEYHCDGTAFTEDADYGGASTTDSTTCEFGQDGDEEVRARIIDKDDGATSYTTTVVVNNVEPTIESITTDATEEEPADEGSPATITVTASDPGSDDLTFEFDCDGDNEYETAALMDEPDKGECTFDDEGTYTVGVKVSDDDEFVTDTIAVFVRNVAPEIALTGDDEADEGQSKIYTYTVTDDGENDTLANVEESCGDNADYTDTAEDDSFECTFIDGGTDKNSTVSVKATDNDGGVGTATISVAVANVAPEVALTGDNFADEGETKTYEFTVTDDGEIDTHMITTACGGPNAEKIPGSESYDPDTRTGSFECEFLDGPATSNVAATVTDNDGAADTDNQLVEVTVANVDPTISNIENQSINENAATDELSFTVGDVNGDPITVTGESDDTTLVPNENIEVVGTGENRTVVVTPAENENGEAEITLTANDGDGGTASDSFTLTVRPINQAPTAEAVEPDAVDEDATDNEVEINLSDAVDDVETGSADLAYEIEAPTPEQGTLTQAEDNGDPVPGAYNFDPAQNYNTGIETLELSYTVTDRGDPNDCDDTDENNTADNCDGPENASDDLTIAVEPINDAPSFTAGDDEIVLEDSKNPDDIGQPENTHVVSGWATDIGKGADDLGNEGDQSLTFSATIDNDDLFAEDGKPAIDEATGDLTYELAEHQNGTANVTVVLADDGPGGEDGAPDADGDDNESAAQTFTITVGQVNDTPTADDETVTTDEDTPKVIDVLDGDEPGPATDEASQTLIVDEAHLADNQPDNGEAVVITQGMIDADSDNLTEDDLGKVLYTPDSNYNNDAASLDAFTYQACDDGQSGNPTDDSLAENSKCATGDVSVAVTPVNDNPVANDDSYATDDDETLVVEAPGLLANDTDVDNENNSNAGLRVFQPGQPTYGNLTANEDGSFEYTFDPESADDDFTGTDSFIYTAKDGGEAESQPATVTIAISTVNKKPTAVADEYTVLEDGTLAADNTGDPAINGILFNDADPENDTLEARLESDASHGTLNLDSDGTFVYSPDDNYNGDDSFTYRDDDGGSKNNLSDEATVSITAAPDNDAPIADSASRTTDEDGDEVSIDLSSLVDDIETPNSEFDYELTGANGATLSGSILTYNPADDFNTGGGDPVEIEYTVADKGDPNDCDDADENCDSVAKTAENTVNITVRPVNDRPVANDKSDATTPEDTPFTIDVFEGAPPLATDTEVSRSEPGANLALVRATNGQHGDVSRDGSTITYTPDADYNGDDSFTYTVRDEAGEEATGTISISVSGVNKPPTAAADSFTVAEDGTLTGNVLTNDTDSDGDTLTAELVEDPTKAAETNGFTLDPNGAFTYKPKPDFHGSDSFSYEVCDAGEPCAEATVSITITPVNDAPTAENFPDIETPEDTPTDIDVLAEANDVDGDALEIFLPTDRRPAHGTVSVVDGQIRYTPNAGYNGEDSFSYRVDDGELQSALATVGISVASVNDAPVARPDSASTSEDNPVTINVLANDSDPDGGDNLSIESFTQPDANKGTVSAGPNGTLIFTPAPNFNGEATFTYTAADGATGGTATVTVTVSAVNDRPAATDDSYTTNEDTPLTEDAANGVLANDSDPESPGLSAAKVSNPAHGTVTLNGDGSFTYTPSGQYSGPDSFTYRANDGSLSSEVAVVSITVSAVNDKPVPTDDAKSTPENTPLVFPASQLTANDKPGPEGATDEQNQALTVTEVGSSEHGAASLDNGEITFTPAPNYNGPASFEYTVCDDGSPQACAVMEATINVTISAVNSAPVAGSISRTMDEGGAPITVNLADHTSDDETADGDLTFEIIEGPTAAQGTATLDGSNLTFTPNPNFEGTVNLRYSVTDDGDGDAPAKTTEAALTITVNPVNEAPTAGDADATVREDTPANINVLAEATDSDGDDLDVIIVSQPGKGSATVNSDGTVRYSPRTNLNGPDSFTYKVTDGDLESEEATVSITITAVNDAPSAASDTARTTINRAVSVNVLANDTDPDGDNLSAAVAGQPAKGRVVKNSNGALKYTPPRNFVGTVSFTYRASDGNGGASVATVRIRVARR